MARSSRHRLSAITALAVSLTISCGFSDTAVAQPAAGEVPGALAPSDEAAAKAALVAELDPDEVAGLEQMLARATPAQTTALFNVSRWQNEGDRGNLIAMFLKGSDQGQLAYLSFVGSMSPREQRKFALAFGSREPMRWRALPALLESVDTQTAIKAVMAGGDELYCEIQPQTIPPSRSLGDCPPPVVEFHQAWNMHMAAMTHASPAPAGAAPWQAQLARAGQSLASFQTPRQAREDRAVYGEVLPAWEHAHLCGSVYIGNRWVLTAAHCIGNGWQGRNDKFFEGRQLRAGLVDLATTGTVWPFDAVVRHAGYVNSRLGNDIALLRLTREPTAAELAGGPIRPAKVPTSASPVPAFGQKFVVSGWGITGVTSDTSNAADEAGRLQHVSRRQMMGEVSYVKQQTCASNEHYRNLADGPWIPKPGQICAGSGEQVDACKGDSGGPMVWKRNDGALLVGLVSFGPGCGQPDTPGVYTDVRYFSDWIEGAKAQARSGMIVDWVPGRCLHDGRSITCQP